MLASRDDLCQELSMKEILIYILLTLLVTASLQSFATDQAEQGDSRVQKATTMQKLDSKRVKMQQKISASLKDLDDKIKELRADVIVAKGSVKSDLELQIKNLEKDKNQLKKKYEELQSATGSAWDDLKTGLDEGLEKLKESYNKAKTRFSEENK